MENDKPAILFVDDEQRILDAIENSLFRQRKVWAIHFALDADRAMETLAETAHAVICVDMRMPITDGVALLGQVKDKYPDTVRIMLTGTADLQTAIDAINQGEVFRFLAKPTTTRTLVDTIKAALKQFRLVQAESRLLRETLTGTVNLLYDLMAAIDPLGHSRGIWLRDAVRDISHSIDALRGKWEIEIAALFSQIGSISLPQDLLRDHLAGANKKTQKSDIVADIPTIGADLVRRIPYLEEVGQIIRYQDKHYNGQGKPDDNIAGNGIPLGARVLKILHDFKDLSRDNDNRYRIQTEMRARIGTYDEELLEAIIPLCPLVNEANVAKDGMSEIGVSELKIGQKLGDHVRTKEDVIVAGAGSRISPAFLTRIRHLDKSSGIREPILVQKST